MKDKSRFVNARSTNTSLFRIFLVGPLLASLVGFILVACTTEPELHVLSIPDIKGEEADRYVGETVMVEGIFVRDQLPMLVSNLDIVVVNMPMPDDQYIVLTGGIAEEMDPVELGGARLKVRGVLNATPDDGDWESYKLDLKAYDVLDRHHVYNPKIIDFAIDPSVIKSDRYAILFSGGIKPASNHNRYWNDLKFMYSTLVNEHGFDKNNFAILYADGKQKDKKMPVHYKGTKNDLETAFKLLRQVSDENDLVFFFMTNHGGGFKAADKSTKGCYWDTSGKEWKGCPHYWGGALDTDGDEGSEQLSEKDYKIDFNGDGDKTDQVSWDETLYGWLGDDILDDEFGMLFDGLKYKHLIVVMEQCFSGGLIPDTTQATSNRLVMAAASQYEPSWAMPPTYDYNEFSYFFTAALNGAFPGGSKADADSDNDGKISIMEAFNFAQKEDSRPETPHYEDNGDGIPHTGKMPSGGDGKLGKAVHLQ